MKDLFLHNFESARGYCQRASLSTMQNPIHLLVVAITKRYVNEKKKIWTVESITITLPCWRSCFSSEKPTLAVGRVQKAAGKEIQPRWSSGFSRKELVDEATVLLRSGRSTPSHYHSCADSYKGNVCENLLYQTIAFGSSTTSCQSNKQRIYYSSTNQGFLLSHLKQSHAKPCPC